MAQATTPARQQQHIDGTDLLAIIHCQVRQKLQHRKNVSLVGNPFQEIHPEWRKTQQQHHGIHNRQTNTQHGLKKTNNDPVACNYK
jgi:hypothetical protein